MTPKTKQPDRRSEKYHSVRVSIAAFEKVNKKARKEKRTFIAQLDMELGV